MDAEVYDLAARIRAADERRESLRRESLSELFALERFFETVPGNPHANAATRRQAAKGLGQVRHRQRVLVAAMMADEAG